MGSETPTTQNALNHHASNILEVSPLYRASKKIEPLLGVLKVFRLQDALSFLLLFFDNLVEVFGRGSFIIGAYPIQLRIILL